MGREVIRYCAVCGRARGGILCEVCGESVRQPITSPVATLEAIRMSVDALHEDCRKAKDG